MDVIKGPGKAPALSAPEVMGDYPVKPWDEGGKGEGQHEVGVSWCVPLLSNVAAGCLGYIVGVAPVPQNKYIIQHLMRVANREGLTQWGRMTLALVCDHKTVQVLLHNL